MKKIFGLALLCSVLCFSGCSQDESDSLAEVLPPAKIITISVGMPDEVSRIREEVPQTRVAFDDKTLALTWEEGDQLWVIGYDGENFKGTSDFELIEGAGGKSAKFRGTVIPGATRYQVYYKNANLSFSKAENRVVPSYEHQQMVVSAPQTHLKDHLFIHSVRMDAADFENGSFRLKMENAIIRFDIVSTPEDMGKLRTLVWENNRETAEVRATATDVLSKDLIEEEIPFEDQGSAVLPFAAAPRQEMTVFVCFDAEYMKLLPGHQISVVLHGTDKSYVTWAESKGGKVYENGKRYQAVVSVTPAKGAFPNWKVTAAQ